ncbi:MAG TPA: hypothetical protein VFY27_03180, partial [Woeseiaceae bacterium]|nr:hypothetical protein [Woeseiaceae bacterium]
FRSRQAFEAAESGLTAAVSYLGSAGGADKDSDGVVDPVFDTDADGIGDASSITFADNSSVTVTLAGAFPSFTMQSVGVSDDLTATRTVRSLAATVDTLPNAPDNPLTTRGSVVINGSATVHNPEGHSTIWSGNDVELGANNSTSTNIADPTDPDYPSCMDTSMSCDTTRSSSKVAIGLDVIEHDSSLGNLTPAQMFQNFFGTSMENYRASRVSLEVMAANANNLASNSASPGMDLGAGEVIWVEGDASISKVTVGCEVPVTGSNVCPGASVNPSIVIVNGNLETSGTPHFYGLLYIIGDMNMSSSTSIMGAAIVSGETSSTSGSLDVWYNSDVLNNVRDNGPLAGAPGSWQDW